MCLGIPGQVTELPTEGSDHALVEVSGARRRVNVALLEREKLRTGDWVLIHVGFALAKLDEDEAGRVLAMLASMAKAYADELDLMAASLSSVAGGL